MNNSLKLKIPPALLMLLAGGLMYGLDVLFAAVKLSWHFSDIGAEIIFVLGVICIVSGIISFQLAKTTVDPTRPDKASSLVRSGIYRISRNPMYLGFLLMLLAWGVKLMNPISLLVLPAFVVYMNRFQIKPEEQALSQQFGSVYQDYLKQTRRWL